MKEKILEGATKLFFRYGIRSVTMDEIASALAVSKKTIYQFFKNKDELVTSVSENHLNLEKEEYSLIEQNSVDAIDEMCKVSVCFRRHMSETHPKILFEIKKYHSDAWNCYTQFKNEFIKGHIKRNILRGIEEGHYRKEINVDILSTFRVEEVELIFDETKFPRNTYDFTEVQMQLLEHFLYGLFTDKGRKQYLIYLNHNQNSHK